MNDNAFGKRLKSLREKRGWSTYKLAEIIDMSEPFVSMLETGVRVPSFSTQGALAKAFGIKVGKLMEGV